MVEPSSGAVAPPAGAARRSWRSIVAPYARPSARRSIGQLAVTVLAFLAAMATLYYALGHGVFLAMLLTPVAGAFLVRLFIIQHDCGHDSYFGQRWANQLLGRALGVLTLTPFDSWRRSHAVHHATSGNLDRRGIGDILTLTVREYRALSPGARLRYRLYRNPVVLLGIGPIWQFLIVHRLPVTARLNQAREWLSVIGTNLGLAALILVSCLAIGWKLFLLGYLPVMVIGASIGMFLFYVQHQFEAAYWEPNGRWDFTAAALDGCSFYDLPPWLHWLTGSIGFHHIHHLAARIPNYRLRECHRANPEFAQAKRVGLRESLRCLSLALWDEEQRRLVGFAGV